MPLPKAFRPLRHSAYRRLAASLTLSLLGQGMWVVCSVWQVVALGGDARDLSLVAACASVGLLVVALPGGALADRLPQRRLLLTSEIVQACAFAITAAVAVGGHGRIWHLAVAGGVSGLAAGLYYPAYSALLPAIVSADDLLAANGLEGALRPTLSQGLGPAVAGGLIALASPAVGIAATAAVLSVAAGCLVLLPAITPARDSSGDSGTGVLRDVVDGFGYLWRTPWLLATLAYASAMVLVMLGPFEVLVPFAIKDQAGGGPSEHAWVLAAFGIGGAVGSLLVASLPLPRRYLTVMNVGWALGCLPLVVFGLADRLWPMIVAAAICGALFEGATVIWGTLLQRRVPAQMLGRVSSLDFFVSLGFMPVSMALAGPVGHTLGLRTTFLVAGTVPVALAVIAILGARMHRDEIAHPLD